MELTKEGLYYRVCCRFEPITEVLRLIDRCEQGEVSIGICGPFGTGFGLEKRIPVKCLGTGSHRFYLTGMDHNSTEFYELNDELPLSLQDRLLQCRFSIRNGIPGLVIKDQTEIHPVEKNHRNQW